MALLTVCSPVGGYGNHLRWLLFMSPEFTNEFNSSQSKIDFIRAEVYPKSRNAYNWLQYEWNFRTALDPIIKFGHHIEDLYDKNKDNKVIVMMSDPMSCLKSYYKFNPSLNGQTPSSYMVGIGQVFSRYLAFPYTNGFPLFVECADLYKEELDKSLYMRCTEYFGITPIYDEAREIHIAWYDLHSKSNMDSILEGKWSYTNNIVAPMLEVELEHMKEVAKVLYPK